MDIFSDGRIVTGGGDNNLIMWDCHTGQILHTLKGHTECIRCVDPSWR